VSMRDTVYKLMALTLALTSPDGIGYCLSSSLPEVNSREANPVFLFPLFLVNKMSLLVCFQLCGTSKHHVNLSIVSWSHVTVRKQQSPDHLGPPA